MRFGMNRFELKKKMPWTKGNEFVYHHGGDTVGANLINITLVRLQHFWAVKYTDVVTIIYSHIMNLPSPSPQWR